MGLIEWGGGIVFVDAEHFRYMLTMMLIKPWETCGV